MEWFRDPVWTFVAVIIGIGAVVITVVLFFIQQKNKALSYQIISSTNLVNIKSELRTKLLVLYDNKPIANLSLLIIRITNTGNESILVSDFEKPLLIKFDDKTELLKVEKEKVSPSNLEPIIEANTNTISIQPLLLNKKDSMDIKILASNINQNISMSGRITGIKEIQGSRIDNKIPLNFRNNIALLIFSSVVGTTFLFIAFVGLISIRQPNVWILVLSYGLLSILMFFLVTKLTQRLISGIKSLRN